MWLALITFIIWCFTVNYGQHFQWSHTSLIAFTWQGNIRNQNNVSSSLELEDIYQFGHQTRILSHWNESFSNFICGRPRWSRGNVLASRSKVHGFKSNWGRCIFSGRKNPEHKFSGRDFKLGVPSLRFQAH